MKKVYFVQVGFEFDDSVYLPYGVGSIIAYCKENEKINREYEFTDIIFRREKIVDAMKKITNPFIVAFSCSVWNMEYNKTLAKKIKEEYEDCIVIFGGHSATSDLLDEEYIDFVLFGEGEETFAQLIINLNNSDVSKIDNIAYKSENLIIKTKRSFNDNLNNYPSPYLTGVFDKILFDNSEIDFLAVLETNRGCPYSCSYCDWCSDKKVRLFPMEKILAEINWLSEHKIAYCFCADSNFGMFERDYEIAIALVNAKKNNGYPQIFRPCYEKNSAERVFKICSALNSVNMDKGATIAYQTLSNDALNNIGRKNLTMDHFSSLMKKYNEAKIPTYSELILGLPGETKESFCKGICELFECGQHNSVSVYHCEVLPNADFAREEYIKKHKIETIKIRFNHIHSAPKKDEEIVEYSYIVRSTSTMSRSDWVYANLFSVCVQCFHSLGLLRFVAMYLHEAENKSYYDFYSSLLDYILNSEGKLNNLWMGFKSKYENSLSGNWNYYNEKFGNVTWFFEEGAFLEIISDYDCYFEELLPFIMSFNIEKNILNDLLNYQRLIIRKPFDNKVVMDFKYDFQKFFNAVSLGEYITLKKAKNKICITPSVAYDDMSKFAKEVVWFGRRVGKTLYSDKIEINLIYKE